MKTLLFLLLAMACTNVRAAIAVSVNGMCNIYGAGHTPPNDTPDLGPNGGGIAPVMISLAALSNAPALQFQASGTVSFCPNCGSYGPNGDGGLWAGFSYNGISGITNFPARGLIATFTSDTEPSNPAPASLDFGIIGTNFTSLAPQLNQLFFIGAGVAASGLGQTIIVPPGATRLYLGFVDGYTYQDTPDGYDDNSGSLFVNVSGLPVCDPPPAGLVAWWPGDGNAIDVVGAQNGTPTNGATYLQGEVGEAFDFTNDHAGVLVGNPAALQLQTFTIETWIQRNGASLVSDDPTANGGAAALFYFGSQGYGMGMHNDGAISLTKIDVDDVNDDADGARVTDTNWHHVAVTKAGNLVTFYIDGLGYPSVTYNSTFQFTSPAGIGVRGDNINANNNDSFFGKIDEVSIYNRALGSNEIASIYAAGSAGKCLSAWLSIQSSGPAADISFESISNQIYTLQQSTNLVPAVWNTFTNLSGNGSLLQIIVPNSGVPQSFFRAVTR
jgi:hypothetical protein